MQNDVTLRVTNLKRFIEICFLSYQLESVKNFLFEVLTRSWKEEVSFRVTNSKFKNKKFHFDLTNCQVENKQIHVKLSIQKQENKSWFQIIVAQDIFAEVKNTIQHYLKKIEPCDVTVDHSLVVSQMKNGHISL